MSQPQEKQQKQQGQLDENQFDFDDESINFDDYNDPQSSQKEKSKHQQIKKGSRIEEETLTKEKKTYPSSDEIKKILNLNLPEMKEQFDQFTESELRQLYDELQEQSNVMDAQKSSQMKRTAKNNYNRLRGQNNFNLNQKWLQHPTQPNNSKKATPQPIIKTNIKKKNPEKKSSLSNLYSKERERTTFVQQQEQQQSPYIPKRPPYSSFSKSQAYLQNDYMQDVAKLKNSYPDHPQNQFLQFQHKEGQEVKAKTYMFVHTVYEEPKKVFRRGQSKIGKCGCPCCRNNTIINLYNAMKEYFQGKN